MDRRYNIMTFTSTHSISPVFSIPEMSGRENVKHRDGSELHS